MERVKIIQTGNENQAKENRNIPKNLITCAKYRLKTLKKVIRDLHYEAGDYSYSYLIIFSDF